MKKRSAVPIPVGFGYNSSKNSLLLNSSISVQKGLNYDNFANETTDLETLSVSDTVISQHFALKKN